MLLLLLSPSAHALADSYWLDQFQQAQDSAESYVRDLNLADNGQPAPATRLLSLAKTQRWAGRSLRQLESSSNVLYPMVDLCVSAGDCGALDSTIWLEQSIDTAALALDAGLPPAQQLWALDVQTRALAALGRIEEAQAANEAACALDPSAPTLFGCSAAARLSTP